VEPDGGHREAALLGQVGQVGGHQGRRCWERQGSPGLGPGFKTLSRGVVHGPGVVGEAGVQGAVQPGQVGAGGETGDGGRQGLSGFLGDWQEIILRGHGRPPWQVLQTNEGALP